MNSYYAILRLSLLIDYRNALCPMFLSKQQYDDLTDDQKAWYDINGQAAA